MENIGTEKNTDPCFSNHMRKLVFFSRSYPYSYAYDWKAGELSELRKYFDDIIVAPFVAETGTIASDFPKGIRLAPPALKQEDLYHRTSSAWRILNSNLSHARALRGVGNTEFFAGARRWFHNSLTVENSSKVKYSSGGSFRNFLLAVCISIGGWPTRQFFHFSINIFDGRQW